MKYTLLVSFLLTLIIFPQQINAETIAGFDLTCGDRVEYTFDCRNGTCSRMYTTIKFAVNPVHVSDITTPTPALVRELKETAAIKRIPISTGVYFITTFPNTNNPSYVTHWTNGSFNQRHNASKKLLENTTKKDEIEDLRKICQLQKAAAEQKKFQTHLGYASYKMLTKQLGNLDMPPLLSQSLMNTGGYSLRARGISPLSYGRLSGSSILGAGSGSSLNQDLDLLTGARAVDESLQLNSIGIERPERDRTLEQIKRALTLYSSYERDSYPENLQELVPKYLDTVPAGYEYRRTGEKYELNRILSENPVSLNQVERLTITPHPWDEMLEGRTSPEVPEILTLAPADYLTLYFEDVTAFTELSDTLADLQKPLGGILGFSNIASLRQNILDELGLVNIENPELFIDEFALVLYDLDIHPATEMALILKMKTELFDRFIEEVVSTPTNQHGKIGEYYVIATSKEAFTNIANLQKEESLSTSKDLHYTLTELGNDYDGLAFMSDAFVEKLTSPEYRTNARRRNTILQALETLQYTSFAYRKLTGTWATSFKQMADEGYIEKNTIFDEASYQIDDRGIVHHTTWGSIYDTSSIAQVPVTTLTPTEATRYDRFREEYQSYWREFIDPVGVTINIDEEISFRTVILPLIDESEYNWLVNMTKTDLSPLSYITNPDRETSLLLTSKLNTDGVMDYLIDTFASDRIIYPEYYECRSRYYQNIRNTRNPAPMSEVCSKDEITEEDANERFNAFVADFIGWDGDEEVFDFIGEEMAIGVGEQIALSLAGFATMDAFFSLNLTDTTKAKEFTEAFFTAINRELNGELSDLTYFGISSVVPVEQEKNGITYYTVSLGIVNVHYAFIGDRFYLSVSEAAIDALADTVNSPDWDDNMLRLFKAIDNTHHLSLVADTTKIQPWLQYIIGEPYSDYTLSNDFEQKRRYWNEMSMMAETFTDTDDVFRYYTNPPYGFVSANFSLDEDKSVVLTTSNNIYDANLIQPYEYNSYYYGDEIEYGTDVVEFKKILKDLDLASLIESLDQLENFGVGLSFTDHGLDIKMAFNNPNFKGERSTFGKTEWNSTLIILTIFLLLLIGGGGAFHFLLKKKKLEQQEQGLIPDGQTIEEIDTQGEPDVATDSGNMP